MGNGGGAQMQRLISSDRRSAGFKFYCFQAATIGH